MGLLSNNKKDKEKEWYDGRIIIKFDRITEVLHFLDGQTRDITYDTNLRGFKNRDSSIYQVSKQQSFGRGSGPLDYFKIYMAKVGEVNREPIPYINRVITEEKVLVIDNIRTNGERYSMDEDVEWYWANDEYEYQDGDTKVKGVRMR